MSIKKGTEKQKKQLKEAETPKKRRARLDQQKAYDENGKLLNQRIREW